MALIQWVFSVLIAIVLAIVSINVAIIAGIVSLVVSGLTTLAFVVYVIAQLIQEHFDERKKIK
jgi:hypothetical protein